ncbi:hypothetical protein QYE76_006671 [Lolium multiflorum]|uniref:F-box domain-containing protein n=1 Tax=Lolium multiflorum TaxID=4521 RepID=A0AAD8W4L0_LOLMU|nr:hypothetical protein QYE76_006671 [Lolium multiflorum]
MKKRTADGTVKVKLESRGVDRLGGLPDDVLGHILGFLPTPLAVRATQLSRRWRRLWPAHVLALNLSVRNCTTRGVGVTFPRLCTEALSRFPTFDIPSISLDFGRHVYIAEANTWYPEAMERAAGSVRVTVPRGVVRLELPRFTRAESLNLTLHHGVYLELPAAGDDPVRFDRLTELVLATVRLPAGTPPLHDFLSSCCPRLRRLRLCRLRGGEATRELVLRSDALEALDIDNVDGLTRLDVAAPNLRSLSVRSCFRYPVTATETDVVVSAPRVESICWYRSYPKRLIFRADGTLTRVRRLSGLKLATLGRTDQFDYPYTKQLLQACSLTTEYLELDLLLPDEMTLLNWLGPEEMAASSSCEDLMTYAPKLPRVTVLSLTVRWGLHANVVPCLASLLSRVPSVTTLYVDSAPYCITVLSALPHRGEYRWGRALCADQKMSLDSLREVSVRGLRGTDAQECKLVDFLLGAVSPSTNRISLAFRDGTAEHTVDEIAAELPTNFPIATPGRWAKMVRSNGLELTKRTSGASIR